LAEDKGFHVVIEQPVLSGTGNVDVSLDRGGRKIACEISVSSTSQYELRNVQKCLAAGFDQVVVLSSEKTVISEIKLLLDGELDAEISRRTLCLLPEEFIEFLDRTDAELRAETTVHGYKVRMKYKRDGSAEQSDQRKAIAQVIMQALKRLKHDH
jgi:hypothetical protein